MGGVTTALGDAELRDRVAQATASYFTDWSHPCGMARERSAGAFGYDIDDTVTTGGTGFGLMAQIVAAERGWRPRRQILDRLERLVGWLEAADSFDGVFPHFLSGATGRVHPVHARGRRRRPGGDRVPDDRAPGRGGVFHRGAGARRADRGALRGGELASPPARGRRGDVAPPPRAAVARTRRCRSAAGTRRSRSSCSAPARRSIRCRPRPTTTVGRRRRPSPTVGDTSACGCRSARTGAGRSSCRSIPSSASTRAGSATPMPTTAPRRGRTRWSTGRTAWPTRTAGRATAPTAGG